MKVVGVGYPRSGTKTLGECFRTLGFRNASWSGAMNDCYESGNLEPLLDHAADYDSFEDLPWCMLYKEFDRKFPGSKFILTVRKNDFDWFDSFRKHAVRLNADIFLSSKGADYEATMDIYRAHNAGVREYFAGRPDFLEVCWESGVTWNTLAGFLGKPSPQGPIPHRNKTSPQSTFRLYRIYLNNLVRRAEAPVDMEEVASTLQELAQWFPSLSVSEQEELMALASQSPIAIGLLSKPGAIPGIASRTRTD